MEKIEAGEKRLGLSLHLQHLRARDSRTGAASQILASDLATSTPAPEASALHRSLPPASARCSLYPGWESRGGQAAQSLPRTRLGRGWVLPSERGLPGRRRPGDPTPPQRPRTPLGMFQKGTRTPLHNGAGVGAGEAGLRALAAGAWVRRRGPGGATPAPQVPPGRRWPAERLRLRQLHRARVGRAAQV